jgi:hypothetical protein
MELGTMVSRLTDLWVKSRDRTSLAFLIGANGLALVGVLGFGWDAGVLLVLYWAENLVVGGFNLLKMAIAPMPAPAAHAGKLFMLPFFTLHYGGFCAGHGIFVYTFARGLSNINGAAIFPSGGTDWPGPLVFVQLLVNIIGTIWNTYGDRIGLAVLALVVSHGTSFVENHLMGGEFRTRTIQRLMMAPYGRIMLLHTVLLCGALPVMLLGSPWPLVALLVAGKTIMDVKMHHRAHRQPQVVE